MLRSIRSWVWALACTPIIAACSNKGGPTEPTYSAEIVLLNGDRILLPDSARFRTRCVNAASAIRSWSPSTVISAVETLQPPADEIALILSCRDAAGEIVATASKNISGVKPTVSVRFKTYNTGLGHLGELKVYLSGSAGIDSAEVSPNGTATLEVGSYNDPTPLLYSRDPQGRFFPWERPLRRAEFWTTLIYTRVPTEWAFPTGWYAGTSRTVSLLWDAFNPNSPAGTLLLGGKEPTGCWTFNLRTWKNLPVLMAIDPNSPAPPDSARGWQLLEVADDELGMDALRPANFWEIGYSQSFGGDESWVGNLIRVGIETNAPTWLGSDGQIVRGLVNLGDTWVMQRPGGIVHEAIHTLGIGHSAWKSVMFFGGDAQDPELQVFGPRTTSVIQLLYAEADAVRALGAGAKSGILGSLMGERRSLNLPGYPPEPICNP